MSKMFLHCLIEFPPGIMTSILQLSTAILILSGVTIIPSQSINFPDFNF